jgi:beta-mannanase
MSLHLKRKNEWKAYLVILILISIYPLVDMAQKKQVAWQVEAEQEDNEVEQVSKDSIVQNPAVSYEEVKSADSQIPMSSPDKRNIKLGISVNDYSNKGGTLSSISKNLGVNLSLISIFKQFGHPTNKYLSMEDMQYAKGNGMTLLLAWEPWNPEEGKNQKVDYLEEIPLGFHDAYLREFSRQLKQLGMRTIIRFGHEMNGDWYPWGNRPDEYVAAYRYIADFLRREGVNASFMWSVNAESVPSQTPSSFSKFYPGDQYVDIIGIDGFNFGGSDWRSFKEIFSPSYSYLSAAYSKSIMIAETASSEVGGNKAKWVNDMFSVLQTDFTRVNEVVWFNHVKEADWRIDSTQESLKAFKDNL